MFDPPQVVSQQPEINQPENIDLEFLEGQVEHDIEMDSPYQEGIIEQQHKRPAEKHYKDRPEFKRHVNTSKVINKLSPKQTDLNKILKLIERKIL